MLLRIFFAGLAAAALAAGQARFPMKYLDDVGHLGDTTGFDIRKSVDLGIARVFPNGDGTLRFEGHDKAGKSWHVWLPQAGGIGFTDIWTADFDRDGQRDFWIGAYFPSNGRCVDRDTVIVLLFDAAGRPVPWTATTSLYGKKNPHMPALVLDVNRDGRAELVTTSCEYSNPSDPRRLGEDRRITGVYQADAGKWVPLRDTAMAPYSRAAQNANRSSDVRWLPVAPTEWPDQLSGLDSPASLRLERLSKKPSGCSAVPLRLVNGHFELPPADDPCEVLADGGALYSDGHIRFGWPNVVIDGPAGRDIYVANNEAALDKVIVNKYRFKILGDDKHPAWLWVQLP